MANVMGFTFFNSVGVVSRREKTQLRVVRVAREDGCVDMLFSKDAQNGLLGMLIFSKEVFDVITKPTYELFGKLSTGGNNASPTKINWLVFEESSFGVKLKIHNESGNFNVYEVVNISDGDNVPFKVMPHRDVANLVGNPLSEQGCSDSDKTVIGNDSAAGLVQNKMEVPYTDKGLDMK